ncbi:MAG: cation diffusion facilitator family transporter [Actinobacteria bacterium]|nr:cation diffusion facilitator family transporter [Actinomycetota bacterium]
MALEGSRKAIIAAMIANAGIAVAKFVAFLFTASSSMLAESIHSVADTSNQGLLLFGSKRAQRHANELHQFGYGRERFFWSFVVALILFSLGSLFSLFEGYEKLTSEHHELTSPIWAIGVLVVGIVLETWSFRTAIVAANHVREGRRWSDFIRHARTPELPVVLLEDAGALIGLVLALIGVSLAATTHDPVWDAVGTIAIGVLLGVIAMVLAVEMKSLLIGESASEDDETTIRQHLQRGDAVVRLLHLRTQHIGPEELLVAAKLEFRHGLDADALAVTIDGIERELRRALPKARMIYLEPALATGGHEGEPMRDHATDREPQ